MLMDIPLIYYINNIQIFPYRQEKKKKKKSLFDYSQISPDLDE